MTLAHHITQRIHNSGPISIAEYMTECLLHPKYGYYTTQKPFGAKGDFTTSPEISQMFGELVGLCLAQCWLDQGAPAPFTLAELGPGRGTLMSDILRATRRVPGFVEAAQIILVEVSDTLRDQQRRTLAEHNVTFVPDVNALPEKPLYFVANEFFDALPIRQFIRTATAWRERLVGLEHETLCWGLGAETDQPALSHRLEDTAEGDLVELCTTASMAVTSLSNRIALHGGAGLIVDYGDWRSLGDTLQAVKAHQPVSVLETPGTADLTAHVDFEALTLACRSSYTRLTPQGVFLERLGITERAQKLAEHLGGTALEQHVSAHRRLTHPKEMGNLFKVLGLYPPGQRPPPGLEK